MATMKALVTAEGSSPPAEVKELPIPKPGQGEILVKVHTVAQNPTDWKGAAKAPAGLTVGCDFAGTIEDANGSHWTKGQRVSGFVQGNSSDPIRGAFAQYLVIEASLVYAIPDSVDYRDAATIPLAFATAAQGLFQRLQLPEPTSPAKAPFHVLIYGGASSVGMYAVQLAKLAGLLVVATASKRNHGRIQQLGADVVVDYNDPDWVDQVRTATQGKLEHIFDTIGDSKSIEAAAHALSAAKGGHIVSILPVKQVNVDASLSKVKVESTIVYTVFSRPIGGGYVIFDNVGGETPKDKAFWEKYLGLLPDFLAQGKIKANPSRELGDINSILTGFQEHKDGKVSAEKLVYKIE